MPWLHESVLQVTPNMSLAQEEGEPVVSNFLCLGVGKDAKLYSFQIMLVHFLRMALLIGRGKSWLI
jgi:hypothetical protein